MYRIRILNKFQTLLFLPIGMLLASCAQIVTPGGGNMDIKPPKVVKYSPDSAQLNFHSRVIELTFDEYIQLKDINNQLIISPPFEKAPELKVKGKTLTIDLGKEQLKPNTTYSINFGNALQDINENNPKENFSYIFSTGSFIDSLKVNGRIQNAFDHKTEKGILVMLYSDTSDSVIYKSQPDYFAKTTDDGSFVISNIRKGTYKIVALKDVNQNFKYDGDVEALAFTDSLIDPSLQNNILMDLFQEPAKKVFLKKYMHPAYGKIVLIFNQGSDSLRINNLSNNQKGVQEFIDFSKNKDTLTYWFKNYTKDSLKLQVSNGNTVIDTVEFKMIRLEDALKQKRSPLKLYVQNSANGNQSFDINADLRLTFSQPVASIDSISEIELKEDTVRYKKKLGSYPDVTILDNTKDRPVVSPMNGTSQNIAIGIREDDIQAEMTPGVWTNAKIFPNHIPLKENTKYHLFIPPKTFTDIFGLTNDSIQVNFKTQELKYYGSLKLTIDPSGFANREFYNGKYIVQLLNDRDAIVRENMIAKKDILNYEYLHPDKYRIKVILDENGNGKWDSGNYIKGIQPEKVIYNSELINIRSNWDADIEWKIPGADHN